ncbi:MAG: Uma2 family endonuclease, partial [Thermosynechococcaceae cyanobacterium]
TLESLQEYVLINTRQQRVECFRRNDLGQWVLQYDLPADQTFDRQSLDFTDTLMARYEDATLESSSA